MKLYETIYEITPMHLSLEPKEKNTLCPYWIPQTPLPLLIPRGPGGSPKTTVAVVSPPARLQNHAILV